MTVVIAKRFDQAICLLADTMISDSSTGKPNSIPGRLKIITLSSNFTVAYSGHATQALDTIRDARKLVQNSGIEKAIDFLCAATASHLHDIDFIVACHRPAAELRRIWEGRISDSILEIAIGNAAIVPEVEKRFKPSGNARNDATNYRTAFISAFTARDVHLGAGVGGFPITLLATSEGHTYKSHSLSHTWKPIIPVWGTTMYENEKDLLTGEWSFRHDLLTHDVPGLAVLAVEVPQAKTGFVYSPILEDDPVPAKLLDHDGPYTRHQNEIHQAMRKELYTKIQEFQIKLGQA